MIPIIAAVSAADTVGSIAGLWKHHASAKSGKTEAQGSFASLLHGADAAKNTRAAFSNLTAAAASAGGTSPAGLVNQVA